MSKIRKAILTPHLFIRDFFNKRFPIKYSELKCNMDEVVGIKKALSTIEDIDSKCGMTSPVDVVFTWVDDSDPKWLMKFNKFKQNNVSTALPDAINPARFENHNELYYSVISVLKNLKWVRNIFIVTDNQCPQWIKSLAPSAREKIKIVDHEDIICKKNLPTFNSHVIEANLYRIKDLSNNFIYFNDDVYVARELKKSHFFKSNGIASVFVSNKTLSEVSRNNLTATSLACENSIKLFKNFYNIKPFYLLQHTYIPLKKDVFILANKIFGDQINRFQGNKFRSKDDVNVATYLVPWMMYFEGEAQISRDICSYFNWRSDDGKAKMELLLDWKRDGCRPDSICTNDFLKTGEKDYSYFSRFLNKYFMED